MFDQLLILVESHLKFFNSGSFEGQPVSEQRNIMCSTTAESGFCF